MLDHDEYNLAVQSAISLRSIEKDLTSGEKEYFKRRVANIYLNHKRSNILRSEILLTGYRLVKDYDYFQKLIFDKKFIDKYRIRFYAENPNESLVVKQLIKYYDSPDINVKIESLTQLLKFQSKEEFNSIIISQIFSALLSNKAPLISIAADGIDSILISSNQKKLRRLFLNK